MENADQLCGTCGHLTPYANEKAPARRSAAACSRVAAIVRAHGDQYFAGWKDGVATWSAKPWECARLPEREAMEYLNSSFRSEPGIHAIIYPENDQVDLTGDHGGPNFKKDVIAG